MMDTSMKLPQGYVTDVYDVTAEEIQPNSIVAAEQWEVVRADGEISETELMQNPQLRHHIEVTMGYGSVGSFVGAHARTGTISLTGGVKLSQESMDAIDGSIADSVPGGVQFHAGSSDVLLTDIPEDSSFVVFTLAGGQKVTFDGPRAGAMANEFAKIYNNSPTFRQSIVSLADKQGGQYSFHSVPLASGAYNYDAGYNRRGTSSDGMSGVFLRSQPMNGFNLAGTMIHEVAHDLHGDHEGLPDIGDVHSREQSIYHSKVVNELSENGVDIGYDVDGDDYSQNTLVFDETYFSPPVDKVSTDDVVVDENGTTVNALDYYKGKYKQAKDLIAQGRYDEAKVILDQIPADAEITINYKDPGAVMKRPATYNVRELILQDLMFASDSGDRMNTGQDDSKFKTSLGEFLSDLDRDGTWSATIESAATKIGFNLERELITYKPPQTEAERLQTRQEFHSAWSV